MDQLKPDSFTFEKTVFVKHWIIAFFLMFSIPAIGQQDTLPPYKKVEGWPPVILTQLDNKQFTSKDLKSQPTIIMYFSPECHHCKDQMNDMIRHHKKLSKYQIILATYQPESEIKSFATYYQLHHYPNIRIGRDSKFLLPPFYRIRNLPYLALYNKKGQLLTTFEGNVKIDALTKAFEAN